MRRITLALIVASLAISLTGCDLDPNGTACKKRGGTVKEIDHTHVAPVIGGKGGITVSTDSTYYCLVNGKIVDVWS